MAVFDEQLTSRAFWHSPYPAYRRLLEEAPVYWSEAWGAWLLTRYDDVVETLRDNRRFTSLGRLTKTMQPALEEPLWESIQPLVAHYSRDLINVDPPDHTRMRALVHCRPSPHAASRGFATTFRTSSTGSSPTFARATEWTWSATSPTRFPSPSSPS